MTEASDDLALAYLVGTTTIAVVLAYSALPDPVPLALAAPAVAWTLVRAVRARRDPPPMRFDDQRAVSPVAGVILLVVITLVLAAVMATVVMAG